MCFVHVLENGLNVISRAAQVRQFGEFVDTHVVRGKCLEIFVRNKLSGALVGGAVNITTETLASKCLSAPRKRKEFEVYNTQLLPLLYGGNCRLFLLQLLLDKGGELVVTVKYFSEKGWNLH